MKCGVCVGRCRSAQIPHGPKRTRRARPGSMRRVTILCLPCESWFQVARSRALTAKFCSKACYTAHQNSNRKNAIRMYRGPNWQTAKRAALERDEWMCQRCGVADRRLNVHHCIPFRVFGVHNYRQANELWNLLTLCGPCHGKTESEIAEIYPTELMILNGYVAPDLSKYNHLAA